MRAAIMKKLIISVAHGNASATPLEYGFLLSDGAAPPDYLERLRQALFLTGAALLSAKVLNDDCGTEWLAPPDLVQRLNRVRFQH
jgi:hypothetical protein